MAERILRRELGQHLTGMESLYFQVEHPRRRMTICSLWIFNHRLDTTLVMAALEKLCSYHPRFRLVPKYDSSWETGIWSLPNKQWKFRDNFFFHTLENPTCVCLQDYVSNQYVKSFDYNKPLWEAHLISNVENNRCAFLWKIHHSMSDKMGVMKALLATTTSMDPKEELYKHWQKQQQQQYQQRNGGGKIKNNSNNNNTKRNGYSSTTSYRHHMARQKYQQLQHETAKRKFGILWQQLMMWVLWVWAILDIVAQQATYELWTIKILISPWVSQCKQLLLLPLRALLFLKQKQPVTTWSYSGDQTLEKRMAWTDDLDVDDIQKVQRILGSNGTLDDVILLVFSRTMQQYSQQHQRVGTDVFRILLPVTFRHTTDWTMKNVTIGSMLELHMNNNAIEWDVLKSIHRYRTALQRSLVCSVVYHVIIERIFRYFPFLMAPRCIQEWYANLSHASMASLVGPSALVFFGGQEMKECYVMPTQCGKGSIGLGVLSYGDKVNLSIVTDNHPTYPDFANTLCKIFMSEFNHVVEEASIMADGIGGEGIIM